VDYVIPGNDDAIRSIRLITGAISDACVYGTARRREQGSGRDRGGDRDRGQPEAQVIYNSPRRAQQGSNEAR
jgi:small subunit ribosomal protein S2